MTDVRLSQNEFKAIVDAVRWIDEQYENVNLDHRHFRVGAKCKASDALSLLFGAQGVVSDNARPSEDE